MGGTSPCASCKLLRRRCAADCIFAPYFPSDDPNKFAIAHKVFGASNISKMIQELPMQQRADAVSSLVFEANARVRDPVYGCVGAISYLQNQVSQLQMQLAVAQAEILYFKMQQAAAEADLLPTSTTTTNSTTNTNSTASPNNNSTATTTTTTNHHHQQLNQIIDLVDNHHHHDEKSSSVNLFQSSNNSLLHNLPQYLTTFQSSNNIAIHQDPLKRESLWT
ncbi:LOB domain-containing protein 12-like [Papaver somniferum]|uniref:LOB domain-containing protein 12-like n=1 Tax=Papaver somniferum TaxID=3469 RepID=UPI000E705AE2|nr:LOB domain-containing protein 12-like [Papaver somniferum]